MNDHNGGRTPVDVRALARILTNVSPATVRAHRRFPDTVCSWPGKWQILTRYCDVGEGAPFSIGVIATWPGP